MVQTRGAKKRDNGAEQTTKEEPSGKTGATEGPSRQHSAAGGSTKMKTVTKIPTLSKKGSIASTRKSFELRKLQLELEAAEAIAKLSKEVIEKKLAADIVALEEERSRRSRGTCSETSMSASQKVERWLDHGEHEQKEDFLARGSSPVPKDKEKFCSNDVHLPTSLPEKSPTSDFQQLAQAIKEIAVAATSNAPNAKMLSRLCTPKDLPTFHGDPMEWLNFKHAYEESTEVCHFTPKENMWRLRKCLQGAARDTVGALLVSAATPEAVMSTLELQYGQPDIILPRIIRDITRLHPVTSEYHKDIVSFSVKIKNYVAAVLALGQEEYLRGMSITAVVLSKLPPVLISKWADYGFTRIEKGKKSRLEILSDFLSEEAVKISKTSVTLSIVHNDVKHKHKHSGNVHTLLVQNSTSDAEEKCKFCRVSTHILSDCRKFKKAKRNDRWNHVKRYGICYKCLVSRHSRDSCTAPNCSIDNCEKSHHKLLHYKIANESSHNATVTPPSLNSDPNVEHVTNVNCISKVLLKTIPIYIHSAKGIVKIIALLDDGSSISLINASLAKQLGISGSKKTMRVCGAWNDSQLVCETEMVSLSVSGADGTLFSLKAQSVNELNLPVQNIPSIDICKYKHLGKIKNLILTGHCKPDILIGQDNYNLLLPLQVIKGKCNEPYATLTPLGWCIHGHISRLRSDDSAHSSLLVLGSSDSISDSERLLVEIQEEVRRSFTLESMGITTKPRENSEDLRAVACLEKTSTLIAGRWHVGLPWKSMNRKMPDSLPSARKRLFNVEKKMKLNEEFATRYTERICHLVENDYAQELITSEPSPRTWYLPHFGVDNPNKKKMRLVFDAAAKSSGVCLNDYLLKGPDLLMSLYGIMLRFRENQIAISADIKDQFLRVKIIREDQEALRFIWRDSPDYPYKTFAMTSLIFGANCSPFIAQFIKNKNALRFQASKPAAVYAICKQHYADDYIDSIDSESTAVQLVSDIVDIHSQGGFEIRNWTSNCPSVLSCLPKEALGTSAVKFKIEEGDEGERTLGLIWFPGEDNLGFDVSFKRIPTRIMDGSTRPTKREMLRVVMSIFDVYGFLSPFTIKAKIMLQDTWRGNVQWDDVIPDNIFTKWVEWLRNLKNIGTVRLPRYYQNASRDKKVHSSPQPLPPSGDRTCDRAECTAEPTAHAQPRPAERATAPMQCESYLTTDNKRSISSGYTNLQLHIFSDASTQAMCAVAYWRWEDNGICTAFITSKCRVAPLKHMSVPRLELQAALLAARLSDSIKKEHNMRPEKIFYWCDSSTVLHWIRNDTRTYKSFIAHRLGEIDELTRISEWRYVPTKMNIADLATREKCDFTALENEWFYGPAFLRSDESSWPNNFEMPQVNKSDLECTLILTTIQDNLPVVPDPLKFSSWLRLLKSTCVMLSFIEKKIKKAAGTIDGDMMLRAEGLLIKYAQMHSFPEDIENLKKGNQLPKKSKLLTLSPMFDEAGVLRVCGRIDAARDIPMNMKHPVILDGRHHITRLIISHFHIRACHSNHETVVNELKQKYWILHLRPTVKKVALECMFCKIRKAQPRPPRMGDLPEARLAHHQRAFTFCGLDLFGPMEVTIGKRREKRYAVLFTCLTVRAIHMELVASLTSDSLIMALRRMGARRGWPLHLYSDNGTNLRGADKELRESIKGLDLNHLKEEAVNYGTTWTFIPPSSPHWGGAWERLIRTVKTSLKVVLKERAPREEVLLTLLAEVEQIVNGRPLTHVSVEPGTEEALTPNHFLLGSSSNLTVVGEYNDSDLYLRKQWRIAQRLADMYWMRWVKEMLPQLIPRRKWTEEERPLQVGDLVVVVDPNAPRNVWVRGRIDSVHPGKDGRVRVVDIGTRTGVITRSAARVARIAID